MIRAFVANFLVNTVLLCTFLAPLLAWVGGIISTILWQKELFKQSLPPLTPNQKHLFTLLSSCLNALWIAYIYLLMLTIWGEESGGGYEYLVRRELLDRFWQQSALLPRGNIFIFLLVLSFMSNGIGCLIGFSLKAARPTPPEQELLENMPLEELEELHENYLSAKDNDTHLR